MNITVKYFGLLGELTGIREENILLEQGMDTTDLGNLLSQKYSKLEEQDFNMALNLNVIHKQSILLKDNDEIALLPPYAGG